jgi:tetratricopeptide (TPR) repeat protein
MGSGKRATLDRLEEDHDNLRAAMSWALETGSAETALRLGSAMWRFWQMRGYLPEGLDRLEKALALEHGREHPERRADALDAAAGVAYWLADSDRSRAHYEEEIPARRAVGDRRGLAEALYSISFTWSVIALQREETAQQAIAYVNEALEIFRDLGDEGGIGRCEWALGNISWGIANVADAFDHVGAALEIFEATDDRFMVGWASYTTALGHLSDDRMSGGKPEARTEAHRWFRRALEIFAEAQDISGYTLVIDGFALLASRDGDLDRAARLSGAVSKLELTSGTGLNLWNREVLGFFPDELRRNPAYADAWAAGESMTADEAVALALNTGSS